MYKYTVGNIKFKVKEDKTYLFSVIKFVMHTIRRPFHDVNANNRLMSTHKEGLEYAFSNIDSLHRELVLNPNISLEERLLTSRSISGLNLVKSGFLLQILGYDIGCIDTHNAKKVGVDQNSLVLRKDRPVDREKVWQYIGMCQAKEFGGAEKLWDNWCIHISRLYPEHFRDAWEVSRRHEEVIDDIHSAVRYNFV